MSHKISVLFIGFCFTCNFLFGQNCSASFLPDLSLLPSTSSIQFEISQIYNNAKNGVLSNNTPSAGELSAAVVNYNNLNIIVNGNSITGNPITSYEMVYFMEAFSKRLKSNPNDLSIREKVKNTLWWVYMNACNGTLPSDNAGYMFRRFGLYTAFCLEYLESIDKERFLYIIEKNSSNWNVFWKPHLTDGEFDSDFIFNNLDTLVATVNAFPTTDEQYRYFLTLKRYIKRFVSEYTDGTRDGLKPDGSGYHHWNNYPAYMYAYNTVIRVLKYLNNTSFQINVSSYKIFRDAILQKQLIANDQDIVPLPLTGRSAKWDQNTLDSYLLKDIANIGGKILGLSTADPILAGIYNRKYGVDVSFNYSDITPFETGFYQVNHHNAAIFRTNNCVVVNKGFNNQLWGSEIYLYNPSTANNPSNRYGRYQSYGAMYIVYPGNETSNGFDNTKWDWNYNPGATTKVLPWSKLIAAWNRIDEYSNKRFAGSLAFGLKNNGILNKVLGTYGVFAMDFQEKINLGFGGVTATDTHDPTFTFKKSAFFFDDIIVCLASNINNSDNNHTTVTTLYQNVTTPADITVNNDTYSVTENTTSYSMNNDNWILDNFGTGFYITAGSGSLKIQRKNQQTPSQYQLDPSILNPPAQAAIGYIDHGTAPLNKGYEYVVVPNTTLNNMQALSSSFNSPVTKPYEIINKTESSHIIRHKATGIYGYALFEASNSIPGNTNITSIDYPCLVMYQSNNTNTEMKLSVSNPDLGLPGRRSIIPFTFKTIRISLKGNWMLAEPNIDITFISFDGTNSIFDFKTYQGLPIEAKFKHNDQTLSAREYDIAKKTLYIYPNPVNEVLQVKRLKSSFTKWKIIDLNGIEVLKGTNMGTQFHIPVKNLSPGAFIFSIYPEREIIKFIKK
ncbi:polysaccharide lyase family 8 super-sandwich domain-containing protein [Chryseobacterium culicis]|uniref:Chondroitin-sulfate-ABC endolyase/exolyase n=1 Tax=Chryseobacterium culicis TaxID=680127 RepID=A0A1H6H275_CHRCI|nr:polysaccharide lyase family 8 super-sandwich domain-containing protein [Chryseobacterium culicis]SEH29799.1 chondroitin-sulfate-ABC endolyase/exolyase [Chryseobacterium culicis]